MATLLIDYENVWASNGLKGVEYLNEKDTLIIFYSSCCEKIRAEYIDAIEKSKCEFKTYKLVKPGKNALDFYITSECGFVCQAGETQIAIISKDKGFSAVVDYFSIKPGLENATVVVASNIENGLMALNDSEDTVRRRTLKEKSKPMDIGQEQARIQEHKNFRQKVLNAFAETEYKEKSFEILNYIEEQRESTPKLLYTNSLRRFGRVDGTAIYQILKKVV